MTKVSVVIQRADLRLRVFFGLLAIGFGCLIIGIIVLANRGGLEPYFGFLSWVPFGDKIGHFLLMGIMSLLVNLSFLAKRIRLGGLNFLLGSAIVIALVTAEELSQAFLPNRSLSLSDWMADIAGILLFGQVAVWIVAKKRRSIERQA